MAKEKKSVLIYTDIIHTVEQLEDEKAGQLFKHFLRYVNDMDPKTDDIIINIAFEPIKQQLKRDLKKWEGEKINKSLSGIIGNLKRWHPDLYTMYEQDNLSLEKLLIIANDRNAIKRIAKHRKASQSIANIAVNVNDNVNVNVNDIKEKKVNQKKWIDLFDTFWEMYPRKVGKPVAKESWNKILKLPEKEQPEFCQIKKAILSHIKSEQWHESKYIPHPSTWLNQRRWDDVVEEYKPKTITRQRNSLGTRHFLTTKNTFSNGTPRN